ncbi:DUF1178 family protein [Paucibacter sp. APW11]|uniref:DUF1178 family protein n=1 Tax=Roseateles aquae TaxID=3077235 RepID=A0ABU3P5F5_9BURK|nr:DUF1178 family protein [Paucibacter sp. APW11]MDT8997804.1 DUF1178 family protein [Paucibacter sp. APW11]
MLVLNLCCEYEHPFEGWFGSAQDFEGQQQRQLLSCPICGSAEIRRLPSAPRLNVSHLRGAADLASKPQRALDVGKTATQAAAAPETDAALHGRLLTAMREVLSKTEDVGERFAEEARRIHYGETEARAIRGQSSAEETRELLDEGIAVLPLLLPDAAKGTLQ